MTRHILSFDVENWFDGNLHRTWTPPTNRRDPRLLAEMDALLDLLAPSGTRATFFFLGTVAATYPELVRRLSAAGHEIACHAWNHNLVRDTPPHTYLDDLRRCRALLQDLSGQQVAGHRAPSWSIDHRSPWAAETILQAGFGYDSSIFPMSTPLYGVPDAPASPFWLLTPTGRRLLELPPAVQRLGPLPIPYGGGLYWRLLPLRITQHLLRRAKAPQVTYLHPWELNPDPIDLPPQQPLLARLVLRYGLRSTQRRLRTLLETFSFLPFRDAFATWPDLDELPTFTLTGDKTCR